jgi:hypothetical protein
MDIPRLQYSPHAYHRMRKRHVSEDEVEAVVWYPTARVVSGNEIEHYGYTDDGRQLKVVTDLSETFVVTVAIEESRRRDRNTRQSSVADMSGDRTDETTDPYHRGPDLLARLH